MSFYYLNIVLAIAVRYTVDSIDNAYAYFKSESSLNNYSVIEITTYATGTF